MLSTKSSNPASAARVVITTKMLMLVRTRT
jgi:hypothetical protein